jgi:hypothetical protein
MEQTSTRQRIAREATARRQAEMERRQAERERFRLLMEEEDRAAELERQALEEETRVLEEENLRQQNFLQARQSSLERIRAILAGPFRTEQVVETYNKHIPEDICITSKCQAGKTGAIIDVCKSITDGIVMIFSDNKKDQMEQMKTRVERSDIKVIDLNKPLTKRFFNDAIESYAQNRKLVFMALNNGSKVKKWNGILFELTRTIKGAKYSVMWDEGDTANKTDSIKEDLNQITKEYAVQREILEHMRMVVNNKFIAGVCRFWVTATPENCNILYNIKCKDTIVLEIPTDYTPVNKHVAIESLADFSSKIVEVLADHRRNPRNEAILVCLDRKNDAQLSLAKAFARNQKCISVLYNGNGIKIFDETHEDSIHSFETISQALDHVTLMRLTDPKPVVIVGYILMNRGISFVGTDRVNPMAATTMFYIGGQKTNVVNIAQIFGRIAGNARPDCDTRTVYCQEAVYLDYQKYLENQDNVYTHIKLAENQNRTVADIMKQVGLKPLTRPVDRSSLKSVIEFYSSCAQRAAVLTGTEYDANTAARLIDLWRNPENNAAVAKVFQKILEDGYILYEDVFSMWGTDGPARALTQENHPSKWNLVFKKDANNNHSFTDEAKAIIQAKGIRV